MTPLTTNIGDSKTLLIGMRWEHRPFVPAGAWNLVWTLKLDPLTQSDAQANIQKTSIGGLGVIVTGATAAVSLIHYDTAGGTFTPEGEDDPVTLPALAPATYYWDIEAQRIASPYDVRTVASGTLDLVRDVTRTPEVTLPIYVTGPRSYQTVAQSDEPPEDHNVIWFDTATGVLSVWYVDAWVAFSGQGAAGDDYAVTVTNSTLGNAGTITGLPAVDETVYHHPEATLATFTFRLPTSANSRAGQIKTFFSASDIESFTLNLNGNTLIGHPVEDTLANEAYSWQCVTPGTWLRLA